MSATPTHRVCAVSAATLTTAIHDFGTAKQVAAAGGRSEATAARWRRGETMPDAVSLARLMGRSRDILLAMLRLASLDYLITDVEMARLRQEMRQLQAARAGTPDGRIDDEAGAAPGTLARAVVGRHG
jgi:transcriptional regulator with XRE-family HTH domain